MNIVKKIKASTLVPNTVYGIKITNVPNKTEVDVIGMFVGNIKNDSGISYKKTKIGHMTDSDRFYFKVKNENGYEFIEAKKYNLSLTFTDHTERLTFFEIEDVDFDYSYNGETFEEFIKEEKEEEKISKIDSDLEFWKKNSVREDRKFEKMFFKIRIHNDEQKEIFENEYDVERIDNNVLFIPFTMDVKSSDIKKIMNKINMNYWEDFVEFNRD